MNVTRLERQMLSRFANNNYTDVPTDTTWTFTLSESGEKMTSAEKGTLSSLSKKGLVNVRGGGDDSEVSLTVTGFAVFNESETQALVK